MYFFFFHSSWNRLSKNLFWIFFKLHKNRTQSMIRIYVFCLEGKVTSFGTVKLIKQKDHWSILTPLVLCISKPKPKSANAVG